MKKTSLFFKLWIWLILLLIGCALYLGGAHIQFGQQGGIKSISLSDVQGQLTQIENIPGTLYISNASFAPFLASMQNTTQELLFQTYEFTEKRIKDIFTQLLNKNISLRMILENKKYQQYKDTFKEIQTLFSGYTHFQIRSDEQMKTTYTHSKIMLTDTDFWIQTANLTHASFFSNREYFFTSSHSGVYQSLKNVFEKDWNGERLSPKDLHPNLVVCPVNCRGIIEALLNSTQDSIIIQTQYITDESLFTLLEEKKNLPEIRILVSDTQSNDELMKRFGSRIVQKMEKPYLHAKMILIDHKILLLGSMNLSSTSLDENREIGIILLDNTLIQQFLTQFEKDRK